MLTTLVYSQLYSSNSSLLFNFVPQMPDTFPQIEGFNYKKHIFVCIFRNKYMYIYMMLLVNDDLFLLCCSFHECFMCLD